MAAPIVTISDGKIKGIQKINLDGEKFHSFLNIPFAKAPVGKLRFKAPEPAVPWQGIKDATQEGNMCMQYDQMKNMIVGDEDCLNLHVFTKTLPSEESKLKPVMVNIYGGAFINGTNSTARYGPEFLLTEDIVLVSCNYRVGFLGFLHLDDPSLGVTGNAGLKDQQLALKWVQKNIKNFNGDPDNVTLFGESAGSVSVHNHVMSESSKGLFHKAILQSGCVLNPWALCDYKAIEFAKSVEAGVENEKDALEVLQKLPAQKLLEYQQKVYLVGGAPKFIGPNIEEPNETAIITSKPAELLLSGQYNKVPILMGYCDREGLLFECMRKRSNLGKKIPEPEKKLDLDKSISFVTSLEKSDPTRLIIEKKITELYLQPPYDTEKCLLDSDIQFITGIIAAAKLHAKTSSEPVYLYRMSLDADMNYLKKICMLTEKGACHADDLGYLFNMPDVAQFLQRGEVEMKAVRRFVKLWTNFARISNPTPKGTDLNVEWKPVNKEETHFLDIGTELTAHTNPESDRMKVWREIFKLDAATNQYLI